jgi:hypothetical protein
MTTSEASAIWAQKSRDFRAHPFQWTEDGFARIKVIKSKRHIKNRYIGNFMYMSFRAHPFQWPSLPELYGGGVAYRARALI